MDDTTPQGSPDAAKPCCWDVYVAAAFGAFCLGLSDLIKNDNAATLLRISETLKQHLMPDLDMGALIALGLLVILGAMLCWVHGPTNRVDGFARGFSVFAILTVASPPQDIDAPLADDLHDTGIPQIMDSMPISQRQNSEPVWLNIIPSAQADEPQKALRDSKLVVPAHGETIIVLDGITPAQRKTPIIATIRDPVSAEILGREKITGSKMRIKKPVGDYVLEIEGADLRRVSTNVRIDDKLTAYELQLVKSNVPLSIQQLYGPQRVELVYSEAETSKQVGIRAFRKKQYGQAVEHYDEAIRADPTDIQNLDYKGYALFRANRHEEAVATLEQLRELAPDYLFGRLNLAKAYCAQDKNDAALEALTGAPVLSVDDLNVVLGDGEFLRVCQRIVPQTRQAALEPTGTR